MVKLRTIGECAVQVGASHVGPEAERLFATILVLATERGRRVSRARLIELIWPGTGESNGRHCLRQTIYKLRQLGAAIEVEGGYVELPAAQVEGGLAALVTAAEFDADAVPLDAAFHEWLPGYGPAFSRPLQEWVEKQRDYVHAQVRRALVKALIARRAENRWADVDALARRCLALDPLNEEATLALAEAAAMTGSKTQALRILDGYLAELGPGAGDIAVPAEILRRRIAERLKQPRYVDPSEAYFVGREAVLTAFGADLQSARGGFGSAHLVWGASGIGKTRLATEVAKLAALQGIRLLRGGCQATDATRPLSIFADVVPALRKLPGAVGCDPKSLRYLKRLTEYDDALAEPPGDPQDSAVLFANVRQSIFDLYDAVTTECPLLFVVDDAHWLDPMSWDVLRELMEAAPTHRLLVLCTSRTPHATAEPPAEPTRGLRVQRLPPLDGAACDALLAAVTRDASRGTPDARLREWTVTVAEGNPLFVRALAGHWINGYPEYTLPPSLAALLSERLNRLPSPALRVLQACAVLGKHSTIARLESALGMPAGDLLDAIAALEHEGTVRVELPAVLCRHDVLAGAAVGRLGAAALACLQRMCAGALERELFTAYEPALLWDCVALLLAAAERERALGVAERAAGYLEKVGLSREANRVYEQLLEVATEHEHTRVLRSFYGLTRRAEDWAGALRLIDRLLGLPNALDCDETDALQVDRIELLLLLEGHADAVRQELVRLIRRSAASAKAQGRVARLALIHADHVADSDLASKAMQLALSLKQNGQIAEQPWIECRLIYETAFGDTGSAVSLARMLAASAAESVEPLHHINAFRFAAVACEMHGHLPDAKRYLEIAQAVAAEAKMHRLRARCLSHLAEICIELGNADDAESWLAAMGELISRLEDPLFTRHWIANVASLHAARGERDRARALVEVDVRSILSDPDAQKRARDLQFWLATREDEEILRVPEDLADLIDDAVRAVWHRGRVDRLATAFLRFVRLKWDSTRAENAARTYHAVRRGQSSTGPYPQ